MDYTSMDNIDDDWESFLQNDCIEDDIIDSMGNEELNSKENVDKSILTDVRVIPKCSSLYISTKTKISYLNINNIDIKTIFWKIPVLKYSSPKNGVIKKQIKYSSTCKEEVDYITEQLKDTGCYE